MKVSVVIGKIENFYAKIKMLLKNINRPIEKRGQVLGLRGELLLKDSVNKLTEKGASKV